MIRVLENKNSQRLFFLNTCDTSLVLQVSEYGYVFVPYWGGKIECSDVSYIISDITRASYLADANGQKDFKLEQMPQIYPSYGYSDLREPAFSFSYEDGSRITDLRYKSHRIYKNKEKVDGLPSVLSRDDSEVLELELYDNLKKMVVILTFGVFEKHDAITQSVRVINQNQKEEICIEKICSANIDLLECDFEMFHLSGAWGRECHIKRRHLEQGTQSIGSIRGASGHGQNPFAALVTPETDENTGRVYAMNFVYSGNFQINAEVDMHQNTRFQIGIHPFDFSWKLIPGETFQAPEVVLVYSDTGLGKMSRIYHRLYQDCLLPKKFAQKERPVLLNSWEANYFNFNREKLVSLAQKAAEVGAELFVLDDGWFGKRNDTTSSVGDWIANEEKLGGTLFSLIEVIEEKRIAFGLWFEPEMVSPDSKLYREHPDWVMQVQNRRLEKSRDEYVLDLSNPKVCEYIIKSVGDILEQCHITYVKWDMNRNFTNMGSTWLETERQKEQAHRYILGLYQVLESLTGKFPDILFEGCAGGGGRCDPGMLYYMPQIWISDDTDAIERLAIQYGTSMVYPSIAMGCHISEIPNHQTERCIPMKTRAVVAMWGNMGLELNLNRLAKKEVEQISEEITFYKEIRNVVQRGTLYRLKGLESGNEYAWMHVSQNETEVLVAYVQILMKPNTVTKRLRLRGLKPKSYYQVSGEERIYSGKELMEIGLALGKIRSDAFSKQWRLFQVDSCSLLYRD